MILLDCHRVAQPSLAVLLGSAAMSLLKRT